MTLIFTATHHPPEDGMKPCLVCGEPAPGTRCAEHPERHHGAHRGTAKERGYDSGWARLSRRARRLQPFCTDCGTDEALSLDHLPSAWQRRAEGKAIRLGVDAEVVCLPCNSRRGAARGDKARGDTPPPRGQDRRGEAKSPLHTGSAS